MLHNMLPRNYEPVFKEIFSRIEQLKKEIQFLNLRIKRLEKNGR